MTKYGLPYKGKIVLYFHTNSEDVTSLMDKNIMMNFVKELKYRYDLGFLLAMEYPGYGIYRNEIIDGKQTNKKLMCSAKILKDNAICVY